MHGSQIAALRTSAIPGKGLLPTLLHAAALFIAVSQIRHCRAHATLCRLAEPMHSMLPVLLHAVAVFIAYAQPVHTFTVALIRRRAHPVHGLGSVGFHADPVVEGAGEQHLSAGRTVFRRLAV